jgi:hypothetical protein
MEPDIDLDKLREAVELACKPQNASRIVTGRKQVLAMPRQWVLERIENVAAESLDISDEWEYRRLLELAAILDAALLQRVVALGLGCDDPEIQEAAEDFRDETKSIMEYRKDFLD